MTKNIFLETIRREEARLAKARESAERAGNAILSSILENLNKQDPGWSIEPTHSDDVILFVNKQSLGLADQISLNLASGEIGPVPVLTEIGQRGLDILLDEVKRKKRKWLRVRTRFEEALARARKITKRVNMELDDMTE